MSLFEFKAGDKVRIVEAGNKFYGAIFKIDCARHSIHDPKYFLHVINNWFYGWQLEKVNENS